MLGLLSPGPADGGEKTYQPFEPRGRPGVVLGYGRHRSLVILDWRHYVISKGELKTLVTRSFRVREKRFPFQELKGAKAVYDSLHTRLFELEKKTGEASLMGNELDECLLCGLSVAMVVVTCASCRGRRCGAQRAPR